MFDQGNLFEACSVCGRTDGHTPGCPRENQRPEFAPREFPETAEGIRLAKEHANDAWMELAYSVGVMHARRFAIFSSADIDLTIEREFPAIRTHEKRAMGAVVRRLMRDKVVEKTPDVIEDPRRNCHNGLCRVLRSLLYKVQ